MALKEIRRTASRTKLLFLHGIDSSDTNCWTHAQSGTYWPKLLAEDPDLQTVDVLSYEYHSKPSSGELSIPDIAADLNAEFRQHGLWNDFDDLIFVAHSMGGILARQFFVQYQAQFIDRLGKTLFFLIASPTHGSPWADFFSKVFRFLPYYHAQLDILRVTNNQALDNLDTSFRAVKSDSRLQIGGMQLAEHFFDERLPWRLLPRVVGRHSGQGAFNEVLVVQGSGHSSISKVRERSDVPYRELKGFLNRKLLSPSEEHTTTPAPRPPKGAITFAGDRVDAVSLRFALEELDRGEVTHLTVFWPERTLELAEALRENEELARTHQDVGSPFHGSDPDNLNSYLSDVRGCLDDIERIQIEAAPRAITLRCRMLDYWEPLTASEAVEGFLSLCNASMIYRSLRTTLWVPRLFSELSEEEKILAQRPQAEVLAEMVGCDDTVILTGVTKMSGVQFAKRRFFWMPAKKAVVLFKTGVFSDTFFNDAMRRYVYAQSELIDLLDGDSGIEQYDEDIQVHSLWSTKHVGLHDSEIDQIYKTVQ